MKKLLFVLLSLIYTVGLSAGVIKTIHHSKCFCSDICELRDCAEKDKPFVDPLTGILFCKMRDWRNYVPNGCKLQACELPIEDDIKIPDTVEDIFETD